MAKVFEYRPGYPAAVRPGSRISEVSLEETRSAQSRSQLSDSVWEVTKSWPSCDMAPVLGITMPGQTRAVQNKWLFRCWVSWGPPSENPNGFFMFRRSDSHSLKGLLKKVVTIAKEAKLEQR